MAAPVILAINAGSSSIKFSIYEAEDEPVELARGQVSAIGGDIGSGRVRIMVIATDEERVIARATADALGRTTPSLDNFSFDLGPFCSRQPNPCCTLKLPKRAINPLYSCNRHKMNTMTI